MYIETGNKRSHEAQKVEIFDQISVMHRSMSNFTSDIESRLDKVYKNGASEKFGFDDIVKGS